MTKTTDPAALDAWYVIGRPEDLPAEATSRTRLLGQDLVVTRSGESVIVRAADGA